MSNCNDTPQLKEAMRRYKQFHKGEDPLNAWTGLGYKTWYKPAISNGTMEFITPYNDRCLGWLRLTKKGLIKILSNPTLYMET